MAPSELNVVHCFDLGADQPPSRAGRRRFSIVHPRFIAVGVMGGPRGAGTRISLHYGRNVPGHPGPTADVLIVPPPASGPFLDRPNAE